MLHELARPWYRLDLICCNPDCGWIKTFDGEPLASFADRFQMDLKTFRMVVWCQDCGARCGVKVMLKGRRGRKGRLGVCWEEDRSFWRRYDRP